ncbi:MAG: GatB/YqeY domain-containing protein, partial [Proteobacteria bacterium]|nr:GatB/YqeY domain-containing protein [Pseudomonadota bacterium]
LGVLEKMLKQRRDSITQFEAAGRTDLADKEKAEVVVIQHYLPAQLSASEVDAAITAAITESGATSAKDMGKVMGLVKPKVAGRTDMGKLSELIKARLAALG